MIQSLLNFIGLVQSDVYIPDSVYFVVLSSIFLFAVAETFRLFEIVIDRLTKKRG
jgi:hypothetical protein